MLEENLPDPYVILAVGSIVIFIMVYRHVGYKGFERLGFAVLLWALVMYGVTLVAGIAALAAMLVRYILSFF